jgi:pimeloyl-ACP methyl ester carboxylesterase
MQCVPSAGIEQAAITANGVELAYRAAGAGPLVLLVHGFPDTACGWDPVLLGLSRAGFRAVAPYLRGYHPSQLAPDGRYDALALGQDLVELIAALGSASAVVVGHDWGAAAAYAAAQLMPERVRMLVAVAIPHPAAVTPSPGLAWRGRHFIRFKLPGAVRAFARDDFAMVDELVKRWSPAWSPPATDDATRAAKAGFALPGRAAAAIAYYRQMPLVPPAILRRRVSVPAVLFAGEQDGVVTDLGVFDASRRWFDRGVEVVRMPGGHFLHREHPDRFTAELVRVLAPYSG